MSGTAARLIRVVDKDGVIQRTEGQHFETGEDGFLTIFSGGLIAEVFAPGCWRHVRYEERSPS